MQCSVTRRQAAAIRQAFTGSCPHTISVGAATPSGSSTVHRANKLALHDCVKKGVINTTGLMQVAPTSVDLLITICEPSTSEQCMLHADTTIITRLPWKDGICSL